MDERALLSSSASSPSKEDNATMSKLQQVNKAHVKEQKINSLTMDAYRRLLQLATAVVIAFVLMAWFVDHPALASNTKNPLLGAILVICVAYIGALELVRARTGVVIFLIISGTASASICGTYAVCWLHHHL
jgi:hypothetical protein